MRSKMEDRGEICHQQNPLGWRGEIRWEVIRQHPTFVLCLLSLACRGLCAETLHWVRFPSTELLCLRRSQPCTKCTCTSIQDGSSSRWCAERLHPALNSTIPQPPTPLTLWPRPTGPASRKKPTRRSVLAQSSPSKQGWKRLKTPENSGVAFGKLQAEGGGRQGMLWGCDPHPWGRPPGESLAPPHPTPDVNGGRGSSQERAVGTQRHPF